MDFFEDDRSKYVREFAKKQIPVLDELIKEGQRLREICEYQEQINSLWSVIRAIEQYAMEGPDWELYEYIESMKKKYNINL